MKKWLLIVAVKEALSLISVVTLLALALLLSTNAEARLMNPVLPILTETSYEALHLPTGCAARIVFDRQNFVRAAIIDPQCLPLGVASRKVPGSRFDFKLRSVKTPR